MKMVNIVLDNGDLKNFLRKKNLLISDLNKISEILKDNVVVFPTDTLVGLLTNCFNKKSVEFIYKLKKRNEKKPLLLLVDNFNKIKNFLVLEKYYKFFIEEWPAPLTLIFKIKEEYLDELFYLHRGTNKLAIRIPKDDLLLNLLKKIDFPVVAPSANLEGKKPAKNLKESFDYFGENVFYYDFDEITNEKPSTIIDLTQKPFKILREGLFNKKIVYFNFKGHYNISAKHKYTFEISKENYLTKKGSCIIGIEGFSNYEFIKEFRDFGVDGGERKKRKIRFLISLRDKNLIDEGFGYFVDLDLNECSKISFVARRSSFLDNRTGLIKVNKTSYSIDRKLISELKKGEEGFILFKEIVLNEIIIDILSFFDNSDLVFLNRRLRRRLNFEKDKELFCRDKINVLKKEKMIQYLDLIKENLFEKLNKKFFDVLENYLKKIFESVYFEKKISINFLFRERFFNENDLNYLDLNGLNKNFEGYLLGFKKILVNREYLKNLFERDLYKSVFLSRNDYLLKKVKERGATTFGFFNRYFIDFLLI